MFKKSRENDCFFEINIAVLVRNLSFLLRHKIMIVNSTIVKNWHHHRLTHRKKNEKFDRHSVTEPRPRLWF